MAKVKIPVPSEHEEAVCMMDWRGRMLGRLPELALLYHIPNEGSGSKYQGVKRKQEGLLKGMLDYCLPVARPGCHGLYIELKRLGETWGEGQAEMASALRMQGYRAELAVGAQAMITILEDYLGVPPEMRTELYT
jgi:hypothetical protein